VLPDLVVLGSLLLSSAFSLRRPHIILFARPHRPSPLLDLALDCSHTVIIGFCDDIPSTLYF